MTSTIYLSIYIYIYIHICLRSILIVFIVLIIEIEQFLEFWHRGWLHGPGCNHVWIKGLHANASEVATDYGCNPALAVA